ncbi:hypothetical protein FQA39_LY00135 [Lamprigera yunnana]|nr:hypothetical protein FQA39_LY00135 [Lamprigera yunnana]
MLLSTLHMSTSPHQPYSQLSQNKLSSDDTDGKNNIDIQHSELQQTNIDFEISSNQNNDGYDTENGPGSQSSNIANKTLTEDDTSSSTTAIILDHNQNTERFTKKVPSENDNHLKQHQLQERNKNMSKESDCDGSTLDLICSELEVPTLPPKEQQTTNGGFLKVSSINYSQLSQNKLSSDDTDGKNNIDIQHSELQQTNIDFEISSNQNNDGYDAENGPGSQSSNIANKTLTEDDTSSSTTAIILDHNQNTERFTKKVPSENDNHLKQHQLQERNKNMSKSEESTMCISRVILLNLRRSAKKKFKKKEEQK